MEKKISDERLRFVISVGLTMTAVILGTLVILSRARHQMLQDALIVARERTAHQEQMTRMGAGLAHETKNPLGIVRGQAQLIRNSSGSPENKERSERIIDEIDRTVGQINSFLSLSSPAEINPTSIELDKFFKTFLPLVKEESDQEGIKIIYEETGLAIYADEGFMRRALLNLVVNAIHACNNGDKIRISAEKLENFISLSVVDSGCGIAPEDLEHVTEPYFTRSEGGCGLGLSLVEQIASAHEWTLKITSEQGRGTCVSLNGIDEVKQNGA